MGRSSLALILIAVGLSIGFRANVWNIGAEGMSTMGCDSHPCARPHAGSTGGIWLLAAMRSSRRLGGRLWAAIGLS